MNRSRWAHAARIGSTILVAGILTAPFRIVPWDRPLYATLAVLVLPLPEWLLILGISWLTRPLTVPKLLRIMGRVSGALLLGSVVVVGVGELFYRYFFREHFDITADFSLLPSFITMVTRAEWFRTSAGQTATLVFAAFLAMFLGGIMYRGFVRLTSLPESIDRRSRRRWGWTMVFLASLQIVGIPKEVPTILLISSIVDTPGVANAVLEVEGPPEEREFVSTEPEILVSEPTEAIYSYPGIRDGNIHIFVVESYGHTLFTNPLHQEKADPVYRRIAANLDASGWFGSSGFFASPAYGGRSWLADSTLLTGIRIANQEIYDAHIYENRRHLVHQMASAGYRSVYAAPGTTEAPDYWRAYYPFDDFILDGDFGYQGPFLSFGRMSDQFLLKTVGDRYREARQPHFFFNLLVSSHVPFEVIPEYIEDWDLLGDGSVYRDKYVSRYDNNWLYGNEYPEGYVSSIEYVLQSIIGFLNRYAGPDDLAVIVGDHQPRIPISEREATYGVPFHILARNPDVLAPLDDVEIRRGFRPDDEDVLIPMEHFPSILNRVLTPAGVLITPGGSVW